jgi:hypothetical protein
MEPVGKRRGFSGGLTSLAAFGFVGLTGSARATIITFDSLFDPGIAEVNLSDSYSESGFNFTTRRDWGASTHFAVWRSGNAHYAGSTAMHNVTTDSNTNLQLPDSSAFNFTSIDLASNFLDGTRQTITIYGLKAAGGFVSDTVTLTTPNTFKTFSFTDMNDVIGVTWHQTNELFQFDNISVNTVPEPISLVALGLGVLSLRKRRR